MLHSQNWLIVAAAAAAVAAIVAPPRSGSGAVITYLGTDTTSGSAWNSGTKSPPFNPSGDNNYGSAGYLLTFYATGGATLGTVVSSFPGNLSASLAAGDNGYQYSGYGQIYDPAASGNAITADVYSSTPSALTTLYTITLSSDVSNLIVGVVNNVANDHGINLEISGGGGNSGLITNIPYDSSSNAYYSFFDIFSGINGDVYNVGVEGTNSGSGSTDGLLLQEVVPEPTALTLLTLGTGGLGLLVLGRKRKA